MTKSARVLVLGGLLAACLAATSWAHDGPGIHLDELEAYAKQRDTETKTVDPGKVHRFWHSLNAKLARGAKNDDKNLPQVMAKLAAASSAWNGKLIADTHLRDLLDEALDAAEQKLNGTPDDVGVLIGQIKLNKYQQAVLKLVIGVHSNPPNKRKDFVGGRDYFGDGKTQRDVVGDEAAQIRAWKKSADRYAAATKLANAYIRKQRGPVTQTRSAKAGHVYTVVGQGEGGFNGDGEDARRTLLYFVEECRVGPDGLLYFCDWNNHKVRRRERDGTITQICGSGIPGDSEGDPNKTDLNHPSSLVFEPTTDGTLGKIYLAAWHNHKVKVYDPTGGLPESEGGHGGNGPQVYTIAGTIQGGGTLADSHDGEAAVNAKYNLLPGIVRLKIDTAMGQAGDLLTADAANAVIRRVALAAGSNARNLVNTMVKTGTITTVAGTRGVSGNTGDAGDASACTLNFSKAQNAEPDGRMELTPDGTKLYVICGAANCVRVIDLMTGKIDLFAGTGAAGYEGDNGLAVNAKLNRPADIAVAPDGTVFISDSNNNVVRRVDPVTKIITTYAGAGTSGPAADVGADVDVPKDAATFSHPAGLELDGHGNLYVCDRQNNVIRVVTSDTPGDVALPVAPYVIPTTSNGGPPTRPANATGKIDTYAGSGRLGFNGDGHPARETDFYWPQDLTIDHVNASTETKVIVVDWNNHRLRGIRDSNGTIKTLVGSGLLGDTGGEGPDAKLNHPTDITIHPTTGDIWIAAWHTDKILRVDTSGGTGHLMYMAGRGRSFSGDGAAASVPTTGFDPMPVIPGPTLPTPAGMAQLNIPTCVKFTQNGDWYVTDEGNQRVRKVDGATDVINTILGNGTQSFSGDDGPAAQASIWLPVGQAAQPAGKIAISQDERWLYFCDTNNERVRRIDLADPNRKITTFAGNGTSGYEGDGGPATGAKLNFPCDVDCDAAGNVYIADRDNSVIRMVVGDGLPGAGTITTFAGTGAAGYSGDGGPAAEARLQRPCGIFVERVGADAGQVYVADTYNSVIRVIWK